MRKIFWPGCAPLAPQAGRDASCSIPARFRQDASAVLNCCASSANCVGGRPAAGLGLSASPSMLGASPAAGRRAVVASVAGGTAWRGGAAHRAGARRRGDAVDALAGRP